MPLQSNPCKLLSPCYLTLGLLLCLPQVAGAQSTASTFGDIVSLGGTPYDVVLDEVRGRLYLVNAAANRIDIYSYADKRITGSIRVGTFPTGAALSIDNAYLYVTNTSTSSLSVIDLNLNSVTRPIHLP